MTAILWQIWLTQMTNYNMEKLMPRLYVKVSRLFLFLLCALILSGATAIRWKPMTFINPGTKRLLKGEKSNVYYYRSLPEKSMLIDVSGLSVIEIRAIGVDKISKPHFTIKYKDSRVQYDLMLQSVSAQYQVFEPVRLTLPPDLKQLELISYNRNIYYRAFQPIAPPKKKTPVPPLKILSKAGEYNLMSPTGEHKYYAIKDSLIFSFQLNKGKAATVYVRAQLTGKQVPKLALYQDGVLLNQIHLSLKRTALYKAEGLTNLTIGKRIDLPAKDKVTKYEIRPLSTHLFIARPVLKKTR